MSKEETRVESVKGSTLIVVKEETLKKGFQFARFTYKSE